MDGTYKTEEEIKENSRNYHHGRIGERFFKGLKDVPLDKMYDLVIGHYALGYLSDDDLYTFLKRLRIKLMEGRPDGKPGIAIFKEPIVKPCEEHRTSDGQMMHYR